MLFPIDSKVLQGTCTLICGIMLVLVVLNFMMLREMNKTTNNTDNDAASMLAANKPKPSPSPTNGNMPPSPPFGGEFPVMPGPMPNGMPPMTPPMEESYKPPYPTGGMPPGAMPPQGGMHMAPPQGGMHMAPPQGMQLPYLQ